MGGDEDILPSADAEELIDFTCASSWERLALDIELELRGWGLHDGQQPLEHTDPSSNAAAVDQLGNSALDSKPLACTTVSLDEKTFFLELRNPVPDESLDAPPLERLLGVNTCVLITADTPDGIAADDGSDAAVLLSAMAVAASACSCAVPMVVPVGRLSSLRFIGRQLHPNHLRFSCDFVSQVSDDFAHLAGLLRLFQNKRVAAKRLSPPLLNDANISAKFSYDWVDFSFKLAPIPGSFASERRLGAIQTPALQDSDPVRRIRVTAFWDEFPASALQQNTVLAGMPASTASRLRLSPSSDLLETITSNRLPTSRIPLAAPAIANLRLAQEAANLRGNRNPAAPVAVVEVRKCVSNGRASAMEVSPRASRLSNADADELASPRVARSPGPSALDTFLTQVGEYVAAAAIQDDRIDEQFLSSAVAALFEMDLGRGIMADVVDALGPNAAESTVLERVSRLIAASESVNGAQKLWNLFLDGVEVHWEQEWIVCGVPFSAHRGPDHDESLITQKLQMINCCVERRRREAAGLHIAPPAGVNNPQGRKSLLDGVELVGTGDSRESSSRNSATAVWEPYVQPHPLVTRDMVDEELKRMVLRAESNGKNDEVEAKRQALTLKSDMMAFKAANPQASLADFVRWFSPADWVSKDADADMGDTESGSENDAGLRTAQKPIPPMKLDAEPNPEPNPKSSHAVGSRRGRLSARMGRKGNIWEELWQDAEMLPASQQVPIFDAAAHGSKALADLRAMPMTQVLLHLAAIQGGSAAALLHHAFSRTPILPSVRARIDQARVSVRRICASLQLDHAAAAELGRVAAAVDSVAAAEHMGLIATSVFTKLPPVEGLGHVVDKLACGEPAEVVHERERELITRMAGLDDGGWRSVLLPEFREFVLRGSAPAGESAKMTDRMYARLSRDEFRVAFRLGLDYSV